MFRVKCELKSDQKYEYGSAAAALYGSRSSQAPSYWVADQLNLQSLRKALIINPKILEETAWTSKVDSTIINFSTFVKNTLLLSDRALELIVTNSQMFRTIQRDGKMVWDKGKLKDIKAVTQWINKYPAVHTETDAAGATLKDFALENAAMRLATILAQTPRFMVYEGGGDGAMFFAATSQDFVTFNEQFVTSRNVHCKYPNNTTLLHVASYSGNRDIVGFLIAKGLQIDTQIKSTCPHQKTSDQSVMSLHSPAVELLPGWTALHLAVQNGHLEIVKVLLSSGADVNKKVHICAPTGRIIQERYSDPKEEYNIVEYTPLDIATEHKRADIVYELLINGAGEVDKTFKLFHDDAQITKLLLEHTDNTDLLRQFVSNEYSKKKMKIVTPEIAELVQSRIESLAFLAAAKTGNSFVVQASLYIGVDINSKLAADHSTALHLAASNGKIDIIPMLIENGINIDSKNKAHLTSIEEAVNKKNSEIVTLLLPHVKEPTILQNILHNDQASSYIKNIVQTYIDTLHHVTVPETGSNTDAAGGEDNAAENLVPAQGSDNIGDAALSGDMHAHTSAL